MSQFDAETPSPLVTGRAMQVLLVVAIGISFVGFVVGIRQGVPSNDPPGFERRVAHAPESAAIPATAYHDYDRRTHGPNRNWSSHLSDLEQPAIDLFAPIEFDEGRRVRLIAARSERRAFDGAPPVVPHPVDQTSTSSCLACHQEGLSIAGVYAPRMSHELLINCTQCHVEQHSFDLRPAQTVATHFMGLTSPGRGSRAWPGAPPTIPHATFMREDCMSCHGPTGPDPIRTSHPWQVSCLQCHAPSAIRDQGAFDVYPAFLSPPPIEVP